MCVSKVMAIKMWFKCEDRLPPDIPEDESFGVEYEIKYKLPNGKIEKTVTEWLYDKTWNCCYPVIAWRDYNKIIAFPCRTYIEEGECDWIK